MFRPFFDAVATSKNATAGKVMMDGSAQRLRSCGDRLPALHRREEFLQ
jgi:hypothetical protein